MGDVDRALGLPDATTDYFDDDDGKTGEVSINALARARITTGCGPPGRASLGSKNRPRASSIPIVDLAAAVFVLLLTLRYFGLV